MKSHNEENRNPNPDWEIEFDRYLQRAEVEPSPNFTDETVARLREKRAERPVVRLLPVWGALAASVAMVVGIFFYNLSLQDQEPEFLLTHSPAEEILLDELELVVLAGLLQDASALIIEEERTELDMWLDSPEIAMR